MRDEDEAEDEAEEAEARSIRHTRNQAPGYGMRLNIAIVTDESKCRSSTGGLVVCFTCAIRECAHATGLGFPSRPWEKEKVGAFASTHGRMTSSSCLKHGAFHCLRSEHMVIGFRCYGG